MKPKILIATDGLFPRIDGIAVFLDNIIPKISDEFDITLIGPNSGPVNFDYDVKLIRFKTLKIRLGDNYYPSWVNLKILSKEIKKADVVFVQCFGTIGLWTTILAKMQKKPIMIYNHMLEWKVYADAKNINY